MASTPTQTIQGVIDNYKSAGAGASAVLASFTDDATIVGSKKGEKWKGKTQKGPKHPKSATQQLDDDLLAFDVDGDLADQTVTDSEFEVSGGTAVFERVEEVYFTKKNGKKDKPLEGRWTANLTKFGDDWKITKSTFSVAEGDKI